MLSNWHIEGRDIYIQDWETNEEISIEQAQEILNKFAQLEEENARQKELLILLDVAYGWKDAAFETSEVGQAWKVLEAGENDGTQ